jgi:tetratricopeptide (TPR) repeat protein
MESLGTLESDELMQLALRASELDQVEEAILYAKRASNLKPDDPLAHYLIGALHSDLGLTRRAIDEIGRAVELDPDLTPARFQLALLHLLHGDFEPARATLAPLEERGDEDAYVLFKKGLECLLEDDFARCAEFLSAGLRANDFDEGLNEQMSGLLEVALEEIPAPATAQTLESGKLGSEGVELEQEESPPARPTRPTTPDSATVRQALSSRYEAPTDASEL